MSLLAQHGLRRRCAPALARAAARAVRGHGRANQTQALLAVWLPAAPTRSTKSPGADTADANVERVATGAGRRTSTPGHWTPDAWTSHGRTLDAHTGHRTCGR
jgi:hypothetical protein